MVIAANHGALDTASGDFGADAKSIQDVLDQMETDLRPLMTEWEGEGQEAYQEAKKKWEEGMVGMREVLARIAQLVDVANQDYRATDQRSAAGFHQFNPRG